MLSQRISLGFGSVKNIPLPILFVRNFNNLVLSMTISYINSSTVDLLMPFVTTSLRRLMVFELKHQ